MHNSGEERKFHVRDYKERQIGNKTVKIIMPLYKSMMYPHLKYSAKFWSTHLKKIANRKGAEKGNQNFLGIGAPSQQEKVLECFSL